MRRRNRTISPEPAGVTGEMLLNAPSGTWMGGVPETVPAVLERTTQVNTALAGWQGQTPVYTGPGNSGGNSPKNVPPSNKSKAEREPKKRAGSIAGKLHRMVIRRMFFGYFWLNLILIVTTCAAYVHFEAKKAGISLSQIKDFDLAGTYENLIVTIEGRNGTLVMTPGSAFPAAVQVLVVLGAFELLSLLRVICFDRFPIRRRLKPLRQMAEAAQSISDAQWNEEKLQNLTYAISHVDAESPSDHVRTNDRELTGIEHALNDLIDRMRDAARQQTRFVSDASHELRTPIAVIKGYADMLDRWGKEDKSILEEAISAIRSESDHMNTLVEQLLFLARGDSGRQQLTLQQMSLSSIMKEVYEESEMIDKNHKYEFVTDNGGEVLCYGDAAMLKQSIRILVDNAAKYTTVGDTITLRVGINSEFRPFYSVQDNGVGMSSHDVEHIFERFYRSDTARNSKTGGTGLGLAIAKWIINRHHGTIMVQSRPEIGTRFTIFLHTQEASYNEAVILNS
ncbi:MAG: HAMP domain-containing histidine kinase [Lachnospiraceae bacterium]|nr:HAMP domain-containing histidine kinase [Lachnospiraceae bacterium]